MKLYHNLAYFGDLVKNFFVKILYFPHILLSLFRPSYILYRRKLSMIFTFSFIAMYFLVVFSPLIIVIIAGADRHVSFEPALRV